MLKKWSFYKNLILMVAFLSSSFKPLKNSENECFLVKNVEGKQFLNLSPKQLNDVDLSIPYAGNLFIGFKEAVGLKESQGKYQSVNSFGYLGKYQFGAKTLKSVGIEDKDEFLQNSELQERAFIALLSRNKSILQNIIERYEGTEVNGVLITESGILAAAHLGGAGSVKKYFKHSGRRFIKDAYGTSIRSYIKEFGGYDTSFIAANSKALATID